MKQSLFLVRSVRSLFHPLLTARVKPRRWNSSEQHLRDADRCESRCCSARVRQIRHGVWVRQPTFRGVLPEHICRGLRTGQRLWCKRRYASASNSRTLINMAVINNWWWRCIKLAENQVDWGSCVTLRCISAPSLVNYIAFWMNSGWEWLFRCIFFSWIKTNLKTKFLFRCVPADSVSRQRRSVQRRPVFSVGVGLLWPVLRQTEQCPQT